MIDLRSILAATCLALSTPLFAADTYTLNIESQPLSTALQQFAQQSGLQIVYYGKIAEGHNAASVAGNLTAAEALQKLLAGTDLKFEALDRDTVAISQSAQTPPSTRKTSSVSGGAALHLAQSSSSGDLSAPDAADSTEDSESDQSGKTIPEILVKGSRSLNTDIQRTRDGSQPYQVFSREQILRSGANTLEEFLRGNLTSMSIGTSNSATIGAGGGLSSISLRGLSADQTLILVDGRRTASISFFGLAAQSDINGIPANAIERIEVLPTTAAGIYGGGATGGVINIILKRDYQGVEITAVREGTYDGGGSGNRIDLTGGFGFESGRSSVTFNGNFSNREDLLAGDREVVQRLRARLLETNRDAIYDTSALAPVPPLGYTTNIRSNAPLVNGVRPGLTFKTAYGGAAVGSAVTFVPVGYAGPASDSGARLIANAGRFNLDLADTAQNGGARQSLFNSPVIKSFNTTLRREFTPRVQAFLEAGVSRNSGEFVGNNVGGTFFLAATDAGNPFNEPIVVTTPTFGGDQATSVTSEMQRAAAGITFWLSEKWRGSTDFTWTQNKYTYVSPSFSTLSGGNDAVLSGAMNIFRDTNAFPVDFSPYLLDPGPTGPAETRLSDAVIRAAGPLPFALPAGSVELSTLVEHRREVLGAWTSITNYAIGDTPFSFSFTTSERAATVDSAYVETRVPLFDVPNARPGLRSLDLRISGRYDRYRVTSANSGTPVVQSQSTFSSADPLVSLRYQPISDITFRVSKGTGFQPPSLSNLQPTVPLAQSPAILAFLNLRDPLRGNELLGSTGQSVTIFSTGNPDLQPEQSNSTSAGIIITPHRVSGLRFSLDWTEIKKSNNILPSLLLTQDNLLLESRVPGLIQRAAPLSDGYPVGPIVGFNGRPLNALNQKVEAYDATVEYRLDNTAWGDFLFSAAVTRNLHNITTINVAVGPVDRVGVTDTPRKIGNANIYWNRGNWSAGWTTRYFSDYWLNEAHTFVVNQGSDHAEGSLLHDMQVGYEFGRPGQRLLDGTTLRVGIKNVFNTAPKIDVTNPLAPYSRSDDPRQATYWISLKKSFGAN